MAACGRLQHIFEKPLPESPTFLESLSHSRWKHIKSVDSSSSSSSSSCREFFGEIHFKEPHHQHVLESSPSSSSSSSSTSYPTTPVSSSYSFFEDGIVHHQEIDDKQQSKNEKGRNSDALNSFYCPNPIKKQYSHSDSFSSRNSESLSMCTEGLGFESSDDVEDLIISNDTSFDLYNNHEEKLQGFPRNVQSAENSSCYKESKRARPNNKGVFPPPISCIGRTGKPWVSFKSFREDGRFILQEIRIPTQEFLHACREDGRLRLQFIHSDDEIIEEEEEEEEEEEQDDDVDDIQEIKQENDENEEDTENC